MGWNEAIAGRSARRSWLRPLVVGTAALALATGLVETSGAGSEPAAETLEHRMAVGAGPPVLASPMSSLPLARPATRKLAPPLVVTDDPKAPARTPAALGLPVRGRLQPSASDFGALGFGEAVLESYAGGKRLAVEAWLDVERSSDIVAVGPELVLDDVRDIRGRRPIAQRMRVGTHFRAPVRFDGKQARVELHGRQTSFPGDSRAPLRVKGHVSVLRAEEMMRPELAPAQTDGARELADGLTLELSHFEPLPREPDHWAVAGRWRRHVPSARDRFATPFVRALVLVDNAGDELWRSPWPEAHWHEGRLASDFSVRFELPDGRRPASLRVEIVTAAREDAIPFAVDLVP